MFIISLVHAQYGSPAGNGNPGYGGTGTGVPSNDYGHKGSSPAGPSGSDGNSEVNILLRACYIKKVLYPLIFIMLLSLSTRVCNHDCFKVDFTYLPI